MKKASEVMYRIANFFIWILVLLCVALIVLSILTMTGVLQNNGTNMGVGSLVGGIVLLVIELIVLAFSRHAANSARDGNRRALPHVLMLLMGIFSGNIFFFLGALFGLISLR